VFLKITNTHPDRSGGGIGALLSQDELVEMLEGFIGMVEEDE
jgi:hypothetical protein